jgi:hypothetical protein
MEMVEGEAMIFKSDETDSTEMDPFHPFNPF